MAFVLFVPLPLSQPAPTCAYVTRMKENVSRSFEMRRVIYNIRISSGQWARCDVAFGAVRCPRSYEISPG
jgi:hypothetical protein